MIRRKLLLLGYKPTVKVAENWWLFEKDRGKLLDFGYEPTILITDDWLGDRQVAKKLLELGYEPPSEIHEWGYDSESWCKLLKRGFKPPTEIPDDWWESTRTRRMLRRRGYPPPDPYSAEETASESESDSSDEDEKSAVRWPGVTVSNPLDAQPAHPTTTPVVGVGNGQVGQTIDAVVRRRRNFQRFLKGLIRP